MLRLIRAHRGYAASAAAVVGCGAVGVFLLATLPLLGIYGGLPGGPPTAAATAPPVHIDTFSATGTALPGDQAPPRLLAARPAARQRPHGAPAALHPATAPSAAPAAPSAPPVAAPTPAAPRPVVSSPVPLPSTRPVPLPLPTALPPVVAPLLDPVVELPVPHVTVSADVLGIGR